MESIRVSKTKLMFTEVPPGDSQLSRPFEEGAAARAELVAPRSAPGPLTSAFSVEMQPLPRGATRCTTCLQLIAVDAEMCPYCHCFTSADGEYHGPVKLAPGATSSVMLGILGLFILGFVFGSLAFVQGNKAKHAIAGDPRLSGRGRATAGMILGVVGVILHVIWLAIVAARMTLVRS
jgi:Domain of unknown function (DUF4190)